MKLLMEMRKKARIKQKQVYADKTGKYGEEFRNYIDLGVRVLDDPWLFIHKVPESSALIFLHFIGYDLPDVRELRHLLHDLVGDPLPMDSNGMIMITQNKKNYCEKMLREGTPIEEIVEALGVTERYVTLCKQYMEPTREEIASRYKPDDFDWEPDDFDWEEDPDDSD